MTSAAPGLNDVLGRTFPFPKRHFLSVLDLNEVEVANLLDLADAFVDFNRQTVEVARPDARPHGDEHLLRELDPDPSSFEIAAKRLGADVVTMPVQASSVAKGETLIDTAVTLNAMKPDILVIRHAASGAAALLSQKVGCAVVNAGDGRTNIPTQALLDL
jgi:aspartate carbamoyltransferase catalytic subunit